MSACSSSTTRATCWGRRSRSTSRSQDIAPACSRRFPSSRPPATRRSRAARCAGGCTNRGVEVVRSSRVVALEDGAARCAGEFGQPFELELDTVVLVTQRRPNDALWHELNADPDALEREGIGGVYAIGDALAPRLLADAIFDGHRLGREIDGPHPQVALPYRRERPLVTR